MSAALTFGLRADDVPASALVQRVATAVVFIPVFVWGVLRLPAALFHAFVVVMAVAAAWELGRMFDGAGRTTYGSLVPVLVALTTASFAISEHGPAVALTLAILIVASAPLVTGRPLSTDPAATTLFAVTYVGWLLGYAILLRDLTDGPSLVLFLVGVTWVGETAAYAVGRAIGRTKLAPTISPGKTVEGALGQLAASLAAAVVLGAWLVPSWPRAQVLGAGALLGVIGQVGDLAESVIKRSVGTKDAGGLIPGHGGVLDRLDSLLFNAPALYYYVAVARSLS